ncbi:hypothetical protein E4U55_005387 [Claviceps digitariae]|nr:hypothetical protein E4U55_005387 [Claviceps digitariae]
MRLLPVSRAFQKYENAENVDWRNLVGTGVSEEGSDVIGSRGMAIRNTAVFQTAECSQADDLITYPTHTQAQRIILSELHYNPQLHDQLMVDANPA